MVPVAHDERLRIRRSTVGWTRDRRDRQKPISAVDLRVASRSGPQRTEDTRGGAGRSPTPDLMEPDSTAE